MANIRTLKALYQPISSAATRNIISSVSQQEKDLALQQANQQKLMKNIMSIGGKFGKDLKSYKLARKGGYAPEVTGGGLMEKFSSFSDWKSMPDIERKKYHEAALVGQRFTGKETLTPRQFAKEKGLVPSPDMPEYEYSDPEYVSGGVDTELDRYAPERVAEAKFPRELSEAGYDSTPYPQGEDTGFDRYEDVSAPATGRELYEADPSRIAKGQRYQEAVDSGLIDSPQAATKWLRDYEQSEGDRGRFNIQRQAELEKGLRRIGAKNIKDEVMRAQQEKDLTGVQVGEDKFGSPIQESLDPGDLGAGVSDVPYGEIDKIGGETDEVHYDSPVSRKQTEAWDQEKKDAEKIRFNKLLDKTGYSGLSLKFKGKDLKGAKATANKEVEVNRKIMNNQLNEEFNKAKFKMGEDIHRIIPKDRWNAADPNEKYEMLRSLKSQTNVGLARMSNKAIASGIKSMFDSYTRPQPEAKVTGKKRSKRIESRKSYKENPYEY
tara:strand:- start:1250 stop:2725 length:1476 start_codon:yes stop_codon:yes gene_type:complete